MKNTRKLVLLALMVSQALILSIVESWIPVPMPVPGVKLGLANIITLTVIIFFDFKDVLLVVLVRCLLSSMFSGNPVVFYFSIAGGLLSAAVMAFLYKRFSRIFSILGISIVGAVFHNIGQMLVASILVEQFILMAYLPVLLVSGIITGCFVGMCAAFLSKALDKTGLMNQR